MNYKKLPKIINDFIIIEDLGIINKRRYLIAKCKKCSGIFKSTKDHLVRNKKGCSRKCASFNGGTKRLCKIREGMIARCNNKNHVSFLNYSSNNITVCDDWLNNSSSFYSWALSHGYNDNLTLDRIDNDKGYYPENCRWSDKNIQSQNSSQAKLTIQKVKEILILSKTTQQKDIAKIYNVSPATINSIIKNIRWKNVDRNI
jgi:hypothetical protein